MSKPILIFGAGQVAAVFAAYLEYHGREVASFVVDAEYIPPADVSIPVVTFGMVHEVYPPSAYQFTVGMSFKRLNTQRAAKFDAMRLKGYEPLTFIDRRASVDHSAKIGAGS